jgi:hypothetical protein
MKFVFSFLFVVVLINSVFSQVEVNRLTNIVQSLSGGSAGYASGFKGTYNVRSTVKGDPYLDTAFRSCNFKLYKTEERISTPSRYDVLNNELEIKTTGGIMTLPTKLVERYSFKGKQKDSVFFVNAAAYKFEDTPFDGFLQQLVDGEFQLLKLIRAEIVKPSYNPSLEVGDRDAYIVKKETLYYSLPDKMISKIKGKSEMLSLFGGKKELMKSFISSNRLGFKNEDDLIKIFDYFNNLTM